MARRSNKAGAHTRNELRIIGGQWRGRKVAFAEAPGVRPTPDRVRETLFNWLQPVVAGARCLDLFAGSGALGLEALSRGAAEVLMVDSDRHVTECLQRQARALGAEQLRVQQADVLALLKARAPGSFDIVFLDPPYEQGLLAPCCEHLERAGWLAPRSYIYMEAERQLGVPEVPENWIVTRSKHAGHVGYHLAERGVSEPAA